MRAALIIGIILIVLGIVGLAYQGISWVTEEEVADLGPIEVTHEKEHVIPLPPLFSGIALAGGVVLVAVGAFAGRKR